MPTQVLPFSTFPLGIEAQADEMDPAIILPIDCPIAQPRNGHFNTLPSVAATKRDIKIVDSYMAERLAGWLDDLGFPGQPEAA